MSDQLRSVRYCMVRFLCAIAILFIGLAHKIPDVGGCSIPLNELAQYTLPDGTVPILCLPSDVDRKSHDRHGSKAGCETCRLSAHILLPTPSDAVGLRLLRGPDRATPLRKEALYRQLVPPNTAPRGPPIFS